VVGLNDVKGIDHQLKKEGKDRLLSETKRVMLRVARLSAGGNEQNNNTKYL